MFKEIDETNKTLPLVLLGGLDDVATERQLTSGWSFAVLPEAAANRFTGAAQKLLPANRTEFHAKEFDTSSAAERKAYSDFLRLLCQEVEATPGSLLACSLNDKSWSANFTGFAERLVANTLFSLDINDPAVVIGAQRAAPALFTLQRLLQDCSRPAVLRLEIDQDTETARFASQSVVVRGKAFSGPYLLSILADGYRKQQFPQAPQLDRPGITIVSSADSLLVQAADVLGNFSLNYLFRKLGPTTHGRSVKAQVFEEVFRDVLPCTQFGKLCQLSGPELELRAQGALTFVVDHPFDRAVVVS